MVIGKQLLKNARKLVPGTCTGTGTNCNFFKVGKFTNCNFTRQCK